MKHIATTEAIKPVLIGHLVGTPIYYYADKKKSDLQIVFSPVNKDPNKGRIIFMSLDGSKPGYYEDGKPHIEFDRSYKAGVIITGYDSIVEFMDEVSDKAIEIIRNRLSKFNKTKVD